MPDFQETSTLRDVIVNADGSVVAAYNYKLVRDGDVATTDVHYKNFASGETMTDEIYNLLQVASQRPSN